MVHEVVVRARARERGAAFKTPLIRGRRLRRSPIDRHRTQRDGAATIASARTRLTRVCLREKRPSARCALGKNLGLTNGLLARLHRKRFVGRVHVGAPESAVHSASRARGRARARARGRARGRARARARARGRARARARVLRDGLHRGAS